jgi:hypothetical protein
VHEYGDSQPVMSRCGGRPRWAGRRNVARALVGLALLLPIVGCVSGEQEHSASAPSDVASPLTAAGLRARLLDPAELGDDVERREPGESAGSLSVTASIPDCDERARYGGRLPFNELMGPAEKASAGYIHQQEILVQRIYSAEPATLASRVEALFATLTACPQYTEVLTVNDEGMGEFKVTGRKAEVPGSTGLRYGYLETKSQEGVLPGSSTATKVVAVVLGRVAVILHGTPSMVDRALKSAVKKATG